MRPALAARAGRHFLRLLLLLFSVSAVSFFLLSLSPLDPLKTNVGQAALGSLSQEQIKRLEEYWGVGIPAFQRFLSWGKGVLHGDFGVSLLYRRPVLEIIGEKALASVWLMASAWLFSGGLGMLLGIVAGAKQGKWQDRLVTGYCMIMAGTPTFWLALLLLLLLSVKFPLFPIGFRVPVGMEASEVTLQNLVSHAVLPALTLGLSGVSSIAMQTRSKLIEILESDYVIYARARGERGWRLIWRHGVRSLLFPVITLQFASVSEIFGGSILVEQVFSYPGLGNAAVSAGLGSDVPLLLGITVFSSFFVFLGNVTADLLCFVLDPRRRRTEKGKKEGRKHRG